MIQSPIRLASLLAMLCGVSHGQVYTYDISYVGLASQYNDSPPVAADTHYFSASAGCFSDDDHSFVSVWVPNSSSPLDLNLVQPGRWATTYGQYADRSQLLAEFPEGEYFFDFGEGTQPFSFGSIYRGPSLFSPQPPGFIGGTFEACQAIDSTQDLTLRLTTFTPSQGATTSSTLVVAFSLPEFQQVFIVFGPPSLSQVTVPAGSLPPDKQVLFYLGHFNRSDLPPENGPTRSIGFDYYTLIYGATLPAGGTTCPADFNQDGGIDGADVDAFYAAWEAGEDAADVNQDGGIDGSDVDTFFVAWENGGCD